MTIDRDGERQLAMKLFGYVMNQTGDDDGANEEMLVTLWRMLSRFLAFHGCSRAELIGYLINDPEIGLKANRGMK